LKRSRGLDVWALFLGIINVWLVAVVISAACDQGAVAWLSAAFGIFVSFRRVLLPSTLRLDPEPVDAGVVRDRFKRALIWQLALGMLLAAYISLNPVLLESMSFSQTFGLV